MSEPMVDLSVQIEGAEELIRNLGVMDDFLASETEQAIDRLLALAQGQLAIYPPPIAGSHYRRTGLLGQLWAGAAHRIRVVQQPGDRIWVEGQISNARPGIERVQLAAEQASVHRGRWRTAEQVMQELQPVADRLLGQAGERAVNRTAT